MIKKIFFILVFTLLTFWIVSAQEHNGKIIIKMRENTPAKELPETRAAAPNFAGIPMRKIEHLTHSSVAEKISTRIFSNYKPGLYLIELEDSSAAPFEKALKMLKNNPNVEYAEPDYLIRTASVVPDDPLMNDLWGMRQIQADLGWEIKTGAPDVIVAVIDSGVDYNHPDLAPNMIAGYDYINDDDDPMDDFGHGTHCAGTLGALGNNGIGVAGIAWNVKIMPLKASDNDGDGYVSDVVPSIDYAIANGAHIVTNSWETNYYSQALYDAIERAKHADILFIAAAGNSYSSHSKNNDLSPVYPAGYDLDNIITVAATDSLDNLTDFSRYGAVSVDIGAPGLNIYSTMPHSDYQSYFGTSMAAPHVAGTAALIKGMNPGWSYKKIKDFILNNSDYVFSLSEKTVSEGRLNMYKSLAAANTEVTHNPEYMQSKGLFRIMNTLLLMNKK